MDFKQVEIVYRRHTLFFSEQTAEIRRRIIDEFRHFVKIKLFVQIAFHEIDCALHHVLCLGLVDFTKLRNIPERSQKIPQTHRNIFHVFDAVTHFQIDQNFVEELYAVGKSGRRRIIYINCLVEELRECRRLFSSKMHPIYAPWLLLRSTVGMWFSSFYNEEIILFDHVSSFAYIVPPFTLMAIY